MQQVYSCLSFFPSPGSFFVSRDVNKLKKIKCSLLLRKRKKCETLPRRADTGDSFQETPPHSIST